MLVNTETPFLCQSSLSGIVCQRRRSHVFLYTTGIYLFDFLHVVYLVPMQKIAREEKRAKKRKWTEKFEERLKCLIIENDERK